MKLLFWHWTLVVGIVLAPLMSYAQPAAPSSMSFSNITSSSFKATWNDVTAADVYLIHVSTSSNFGTYSSFGTSANEYTVSELTAATVYYFRVRSQPYSGTASAWSQTWSVTTSNPPPSAPTGVTATNVATSSFVVSWNAVNSATSYTVEVAGSGAFSAVVYTNFTTGTSLSIPGLSAGTQYFFRVRATGASGTSTNTVSMTYTLTNAPSTLTTTNVSENSFTANWTSVSGASAYVIDVSTTNNFTTFVSGYQNKSVTGTSEAVTGLSSRIYYYRVRAKNAINLQSQNSVTAVVSGLNHNYVRTIDVQSEGLKTVEQVEGAGMFQRTTKYDFFDGLGRPIQEVTVKASPMGNDIVQPIAYDAYGRETVKYLPYASGNGGWYKSDFVTSDNANYQTLSSPQYKFYQTTPNIAIDAEPYAESILESSPLNRVLKQGAPGATWQPNTSDYSTPTDHTVAYAYETNTENEVLLWTYTPPTQSNLSGSVAADRSYDRNQLSKKRTKDEHHNEVIEYTDKEGRIVLKKIQAPDNQWADTYYIYDEYGSLILVLPPEAVKALTAN